MVDRAVSGNEDDLASVGDLGVQGEAQGEAVVTQSTLAPFRSALIGACITVFFMSAVLAIGVSAGTPFLVMLGAAAGVGILGGTLINGFSLARIQRLDHPQLLQYIDKLSKFRMRARSSTFETLKVDDPAAIGRLSREVHRLLTEVYQGYSESIHLRRTMESTIEIETRKATARMNHDAYLDQLTGLGNRRALDETLPQIIAEAQQNQGDVIFLTIDVDYFKDVNDNIGHDRGDAILCFLADAIRSVIRESDYGFRFGGDEFIITLTELSLAEADGVALRLQKRFAQLPWSADLQRLCRKPSLSIGGASFEQTGATSIPELLKYSDEAMYGAKRAGKGRENIVGAPVRQAA